MSTTHYLGIDLGAESGRVMLGSLANGELSLEEIHRFPNRTQMAGGHLRWNLPQLEAEILAGIEQAAARNLPISGISTDSWGVDYVLLDAEGETLSAPICYRDARHEPAAARLLKRLPFPVIYAATGIQYLPFNTLFQFEAEGEENAVGLQAAHRFLTIADYFNARLSGVEVIDESMASTTQLYNPTTRDWSGRLISSLAVPRSIFPPVVPCGSLLGPIRETWRKRAALDRTQVVASCSHDTGAAVAAVPATGTEEWAYLSSGTWSLLGAELNAPVLTEAARTAGFTNEVGMSGTIRFLKNIAGLWVLQECRRAWEAEGASITYAELTEQAEASGPAVARISLHDPRFLNAGQMPDKIASFCRETGQPIPLNFGQYARVILESLASAYAECLEQLEAVTGKKFAVLHLVGGGSRNDLLNQLTADATGLRVVAGPAEATVIGNILVQALALEHLGSLRALRRTVEASFPTKTFIPQPAPSLQHANRE